MIHPPETEKTRLIPNNEQSPLVRTELEQKSVATHIQRLTHL